jgi:hypothetical protein
MKKLLLVGTFLALLPGVSFADSPLITGLDATSGQHVPFPIDHTTGLPQIETTTGLSTTSPSYQKPASYTNTGGDVFNQSVTTAYTLACPAGSTLATVAIIGGAVEYRTDGTAPTATVGIPAGVTTSGVPITFSSNLANISFIAQSGTTTTISYECFK